MKKTFTLTCLAALAAVGLTAKAQETAIPNPTFHAPIPGISMFSAMAVVWDYLPIEEGPDFPYQLTLVTPSGKEYSAKSYTAVEAENDEPGGFATTKAPQVENALCVSYYSALAAEGLGGFTEEGIYTLTIPAGCVSVNGTPIEETVMTYKLGAQDTMEMATYSPVSTSELTTICISWDGQTIKPTRAGNFGMGGVLTHEDNETELMSGAFSFADAEGNPTGEKVGQMLIVDIALYVQKGAYGVYELNFPGGQIQNDKQEVNPSQTFVVNYISEEEGGVNVIDADNEGNFNVYSLSGAGIMKTADRNALRNLGTGIYVINGKKVLIKK